MPAYWMIDCYNSESTSFAGFELSGTADSLSFSANQTWNQGEHTASIAKTTLTLNEDKTQATGSYTDNNNSSGTVTLDFEDGELYITLTGSGTWSMTVPEGALHPLIPTALQRQYTSKRGAAVRQVSSGATGHQRRQQLDHDRAATELLGLCILCERSNCFAGY